MKDFELFVTRILSSAVTIKIDVPRRQFPVSSEVTRRGKGSSITSRVGGFQIFPASRIQGVEDRSPPVPNNKQKKTKGANKLYTINNK